MWPYIEPNVERLVALYEQIEGEGRTWRPAADESNSLAAIVNHTLGTARDNLIGTIGGEEMTYRRQADFDEPELAPDVVRGHWTDLRARSEGCLERLSD